MPVARRSTSVEWPIMVKHYVDSRWQIEKSDKSSSRGRRTWANTSEIKTINDIGMYGTLLAF